MATIINDEQERPQTDDTQDNLDDFAVSEEVTQAEPVEDVPEKYRNKTAAELVKMHQEAESLSGRQSNEVGELRRVVDDFITQQTELSQDTQDNGEEIDVVASDYPVCRSRPVREGRRIHQHVVELRPDVSERS